MSSDDLEPVDLQSIELQPVDLQPVGAETGGDAPRFDGDQDRRPSWIWIGIVGAVLVAWAAIALITHGSHDSSAPPPTPPPTAVPSPSVVPTAQVDPVTTLAPKLWTGLRGLGSGRFAAVIADRLFVLNDASTEAEASLITLPEGHLTIDEQSGSSILASTFAETLVATTSKATRTLTVRDTAIPAASPGQWWYLRNDGTIRADSAATPLRIPTGLRVVAALKDGFVGIDAPDFRWVFWSGATSTRAGTVKNLLAPGYQLLVTGPNLAVFKFGCGYSGCGIAIVDVEHGAITTNRFPSAPQFAAFSPDDSRLALASNQGDVMILDTKTGGVVSGGRTISAAVGALPFSWTPDGRSLLVVGTHDVKVVRASDGVITKVIPATAGLEQLVALP